MKFRRILKETKLFWPASIDISDGQLMDDSGYFAQLSAIWDRAKMRAISFNEYNQIMVWAIYCGLHKLAIAQLKMGVHEIQMKDIDLDYVQQKFAESLRYCQHAIKRTYVNDLELKAGSKIGKHRLN